MQCTSYGLFAKQGVTYKIQIKSSVPLHLADVPLYAIQLKKISMCNKNDKLLSYYDIYYYICILDIYITCMYIYCCYPTITYTYTYFYNHLLKSATITFTILVIKI